MIAYLIRRLFYGALILLGVNLLTFLLLYNRFDFARGIMGWVFIMYAVTVIEIVID